MKLNKSSIAGCIVAIVLAMAGENVAWGSYGSVSVCGDAMASEEEMKEEQGEGAEDAEDEKMEMLLYDMEMALGTAACESKADEVIKYASEKGDEMKKLYGLTTKMTAYLTLSQYDRLDAFADSLVRVTEFDADTEYYYFYILYLRSVSNIEQGKYKLALQYADELYKYGKDLPDVRDFDYREDEVPQAVRNRCNALTCMGLANREMGQIDDALRYFDECIEISSGYGVPMMVVALDALTSRMETSLKISDKEKVLISIDEYSRELEKFSSYKDVEDLYSNISLEGYLVSMHAAYVDVLCELNRPDEARYHLDEAQKLLSEYEMTEQPMADIDGARAKYYKKIGQNVTAMAYADSAANYYKVVSKPTLEVELLKLKLDVMHNAKLYDKEYDVAQRIIMLSDSLANERYNSQIEEMYTIMHVDKLESETKTLEAQRKLWVLICVVVVLGALFVVFYLNYRRGKEKQKILAGQKEMLEAEVTRQTSELRKQKGEIEQKNRDITDSINYAQRIQNSMLPDLSQYKNYGIEGAFAFFIPCNIVSGDFYWATKHEDTLVIVCSDCTGHGVPGAFMSMIGATSLNEICSKPELPEPGEILEQLDQNVMNVLRQSGDQVRDGMDIAIMTYNPKTNELKTSGARRPIYIIHPDGVLEETKGVKRSIGEMDEKSRMIPFETTAHEISKGDTLYMCSDGIGDQFGGQSIHGEQGKRLMSGGLKKMLAKIVMNPIEEQEGISSALYWEWRGTCPQLDDISLVGVRF